MGLDIINKIKKNKNLTSRQLAKKSGVPLGTINKILCGVTSNPKLETLKAIADALECKIDDFNIIDNVKSNNELYNDYFLANEEKNLIFKYRQLSSKQKKEIYDYVEFKLYQNANENQ
jgi:transcriptional regulator with XRE-family HTH domain